MRIFCRHLLVGDKACHRRYQRAQPAHVGADDERRVIIAVTAQQHRRRHIADNLADKDAYQYLVAR